MFPQTLNASIGKERFIQHQSEIESALLQLANALGNPISADSNSRFFHQSIVDQWDLFEDLCIECHRQEKETDDQINTLDAQLIQSMEPELVDTFRKFRELVTYREASALDCAFLIGYQTAFRLMMVGMSPAAKIFENPTE